MAAQQNMNVQARLAWYARWLLIGAALLTKHTGLRVPHRFVIAVTNRSWRMQIGNGPWQRVRIDNQGRIVK
jgi:hypothetical protein